MEDDQDQYGSWKLGAFFLFGLVILGFITFFTPQIPYFSSAQEMDVYFASVTNVRSGDPVRVQGVQKGTVESVHHVRPDEAPENHPEKRVRVRVNLLGTREDLQQELSGRYNIQIQSTSLLGGKFVSIERVPEDREGGTPLSFDEPNIGVESGGGFDEMTDWFDQNRQALSKIVNEVEQAVTHIEEVSRSISEGRGTAGRLVRDEEMAENLSSSLEDIRRTAAEVRQLTESDGTVRRLFENEELYENMEAFSEKARNLAERIEQGEGTLGQLVENDQIGEDIQAVAEQAREISERLNRGEGTLGKLLTEEDVYNDLRAVTEDARKITRDITEQKGTAGRLIHDEEMGEDVREAVSEIRRASESLRKTAEEVEKGEGTLGRLIYEDDLYREARETMEGVQSVLQPVEETKTFAGADTRYFFGKDHAIHRAYIRIHPREEKFLQVGMVGFGLRSGSTNLAFENDQKYGEDQFFTQPDVQLGQKLMDRKLTLRGGLIEGKVGVGADYDFFVDPLDRNIRWTVEGRSSYGPVEVDELDEDVSGPLIRSSLSTKLFRRTRIQLGMNRIGDEPEFFAGFGMEYEDEDVRNFFSLIGLAN